MTTETMREAVARAIAKASCGNGDCWRLYTDEADAAIRTVLERLREHQTPVRMSSTGPDGVPSYPTEHQMQYIWQAMLDAAAREVIRDPAPSGPST